MDENNNGNFFDKNTILAIVLSLVFFMGWQTYMQKKYPDTYKTKDEANVAAVEDGEAKIDPAETVEAKAGKEEESVVDVQISSQEKSFVIENPLWSGELVSAGMGFKHIELAQFSDRDDKKISFVSGPKSRGNFATYYNGKPLNFNVEKKGDNHFTGTTQVEGVTLFKEIIIDSSNYTLEVTVKSITGLLTSDAVLETKISNQVLKVSSSMFKPAYEGTEFFAINDGSEERDRIDIEKPFNEKFNKTALTSIGSQYFAIALNDGSSMIPKAEMTYNPESQVAYASVFHQATDNGKKFDIKYTGFVGPKKYDVLKKLDPNFVSMINYGMFSVLSKPMLRMLKWLYGMFQNWGLAIIFLTIFIRLLLLPINVSSLKSMKKMQKIQPQLKAIKEKYKSDPTRMNQETMALMKKEGANPLGGCLPMFLQLPVFFALYSVLGQSVELYKSPFVFWIQDLSYQDPFFVLPIAVGILYFVQMSITPQPTDPAQAKVMKFIPILFCFFMITVPSGLTLYFFVNTVFGIGQSFIFQREKNKAAA